MTNFFHLYPYTDLSELNLDWILKAVKSLLAAMQTCDEWMQQHEQQYQELKDLYDQIVAGNFPDSIKNAFYSWMQLNALDLVGSLVKMVSFGITDSGYFVATIPESWDDVIFTTTGLDETIAGVDYGHLVLSMEVDT